MLYKKNWRIYDEQKSASFIDIDILTIESSTLNFHGSVANVFTDVVFKYYENIDGLNRENTLLVICDTKEAGMLIVDRKIEESVKEMLTKEFGYKGYCVSFEARASKEKGKRNICKFSFWRSRDELLENIL